MNFLTCKVLLLSFSICFIACEQKSDLKSLKNLRPKKNKAQVTNAIESENSAKLSDKFGSSKISELPDTKEVMELPNNLEEISGLSFDASANGLIAHDDELAILYNINFEKREIVSKQKIGDIGDYEGVEKVGSEIFLLNSGGEILAYNLNTEQSQKYSTGLNAINNTEGLGFYNGNLLVACKGKPEKESTQDFKDCRSIYSFSLNSKSLSEVPFMLISESMLSSFATGASSGEKDRMSKFAPSGIAIHPETNLIYILSNKGRMLLVTNGQAVIQKLYFLDYKKHRQPEGICFDTQSRMYISNEGDGDIPLIYQYSNY